MYIGQWFSLLSPEDLKGYLMSPNLVQDTTPRLVGWFSLFYLFIIRTSHWGNTNVFSMKSRQNWIIQEHEGHGNGWKGSSIEINIKQRQMILKANRIHISLINYSKHTLNTRNPTFNGTTGPQSSRLCWGFCIKSKCTCMKSVSCTWASTNCSKYWGLVQNNAGMTKYIRN